MKKIILTNVLFVCLILGLNAQATLPYETFSKEDFNDELLFPRKSNATWEDSDEGRIKLPKGASFTFQWDGVPGNLSFQMKSDKGLIFANGKLKIEISKDNGATWETVVNGEGLSGDYSDHSYSLPTNARMICVTNSATSSSNSTTYLRYLRLNDYSLDLDSTNILFPETKALNTVRSSVLVKGKNLSSNLTLELMQDSSQFSLPQVSITKESAQSEEGIAFEVEFSPYKVGLHRDTLIVKDGSKSIFILPLEGNAPSFQAFVTVADTLESFGTEYLKWSAPQKVYLNTLHLSSNLVVKAPEHFEVSLDSTNYFKTLSIDYSRLNEVSDTTFYIRLNTSSVGRFSGDVLIENPEAKEPNQIVTIEGRVVKATPKLKELPTVDRNLNWGETLSDLQFEGGIVVNAKGEKLKGTYRWLKSGDFVPEIGLNTMAIYFVPDNSYGYETVNGEVNIRVLKRPQTVTWDQEFDIIRVGDQVTLTAKSSSELPIVYEVNKPGIVTVENSILTALTTGRIRVLGTQPGNDKFEAAGGVAYYITVQSPLSIDESSLPKTAVRWIDRRAGQLSIQSEQAFTASVMDSQGRVISTAKGGDTGSTITLSIEASSGLYFVRIVYSQGGSEVIKIMK